VLNRPLRSRASEISLDQTRRVSERSEFSSCSKLIEKRREPEGQAVGCPFLWFVSFGQTKEMSASRQRGELKRKKTIGSSSLTP
jgi:hypothetical protein